MSIRIGLIGAGLMGADHARILATEVPGVTLQYICDADAARSRSVADAYGAVHATSDPLAVIADKWVDAVLIASPDQTHAPLTKACIEAGKPVLCEKPLSQDSRECLEVIAAEVKGGKRLAQIAFMRRFDPAYVEMKAALDKGLIGPALMFHCFHRNVSAPANFTGLRMALRLSIPVFVAPAHGKSTADVAWEARWLAAGRACCTGCIRARSAALRQCASRPEPVCS